MAAGFIIVAGSASISEFLIRQVYRLVKDYFSGALTSAGATLSIYSFSGAIAFLAIGPLIDRYGPRKLMLAGIPMAGIGFILLSFTSSQVIFNIILGGLLGVGLKAGFLLPVQTATANWFIRRRSLALALIMTAAVLGEETLALSGIVTDQVDWRAAFQWLGAGVLLVGIPLAFVFRQRPEQYGYLPDGARDVSDKPAEVNFTLRHALKTRTFWLLTIATPLPMMIFNLVNFSRAMYLRNEAGFDPAIVNEVTQLIPLMGIAGILIFGYLGDRFPKRYLLAGAVLIQSASMVIVMLAGNTFQLYLYAFVFALGSGTVPLLLAIRADYFGRKAFATITVATIFLGGLVNIPFSLFWPLVTELTHNSDQYYQLTFLLSTLLSLIPAAIFFFAKPPSSYRNGLSGD